MIQGQVQDVVWLDKTVREIQSTKLPAYFIPKGTLDPVDAKVFYAVISRTRIFVTHHEANWNRLVQQEYLHLHLHKDWDVELEMPVEDRPEFEDKAQDESMDDRTAKEKAAAKIAKKETPGWPKKLKAQVLSCPGGIRDLTGHCDGDKYPDDLVLAVRSCYLEHFRIIGSRDTAQSVLEVGLFLVHTYLRYPMLLEPSANYMSTGERNALELCVARIRLRP